MTDNTEPAEFWAGETCEYCGGQIVEKVVTLHRQAHGHSVLIGTIPVGVCVQCGALYFAANVLKTLAEDGHGQDWRRAVETLIAEVQSRSAHFSSEEIENDITLAAQEAQDAHCARRLV